MDLRERYLFYSRLAVLLKAGLPLDRALEALAHKAGGTGGGQVPGRLGRSVIEGHSLAEAMRAIHEEFPALDVEIISAGETAESLPLTLRRLANHLEHTYRLVLKQRPWNTYLKILTILAALLLAAMITIQLSQQGKPISLDLFFRGGSPVIVYPQFVIALLFLLLFICSILLVYGSMIMDWLLMQIPWLSWRVLLTEWINFCGSMALALRAGYPLSESVVLASASVNNWALRSALEKLEGPLVEGNSFGEALDGLRGVPPTLADLARSGEDQGDLAGLLETLSREWEPRHDHPISVAPLLILSILVIALVWGSARYMLSPWGFIE